MSTFDGAPPRPGLDLIKRMAIAMAVIVACTSGAVATTVLLEVKGVADAFEEFSVPIPEIDEKGVLDDVDPGGPQTILVLGADRRLQQKKEGIKGLADTAILIRLDPSKGATAIMSIPRDLRVNIPGVGKRKINEAYATGGPKLSVRTIRNLLGIPINHVVNINFGGFRRAVDRLGCVFADVDRRYFNDNMPPAGGGDPYAVIDIKAGYQRLCGEDALSFVRFRHLDNDLVRAARQQDFLRQAKDQIGVSRLFSDRKTLLRIFAKYTQTDIRGESAILRLLKLAVESAKNPIQEVQFQPVTDDGPDLVVSDGTLKRLSRQFMDAKGTQGARGKVDKSKKDKEREKTQKRRRTGGKVPAGLFANRRIAEDLGVRLATDPKTPIRFPVYFPKVAALGSVYRPDDTRAYRIRDRGKNKYQAYRIVLSAPGTGQFYGVQGTSWKAPPILDNPTETRRVNGRKLELHRDGGRLRLVAWRTPRAVYWVSNTLLQTLTNKQMLGIAESFTRVGS